MPNITFHVKHHPRIRGFHSFLQYPLFVQQHHPCAHDSFHTRAIITPADVAKAHCDCRHHKHSKAIQRSTLTSSTPPRIKPQSHNARHHSSNQLSRSTSAFVVSMFHVKPYHALHSHPHTTTCQTTPYYHTPERQRNPPLKQGLIEWSTDRTSPHVRRHIHSDQNRRSALSYPMRAPPPSLWFAEHCHKRIVSPMFFAW